MFTLLECLVIFGLGLLATLFGLLVKHILARDFIGLILTYITLLVLGLVLVVVPFMVR